MGAASGYYGISRWVGENLPETGQSGVTSATQPSLFRFRHLPATIPDWAGGDTSYYGRLRVDGNAPVAGVWPGDDHPSIAARTSSV